MVVIESSCMNKIDFIGIVVSGPITCMVLGKTGLRALGVRNCC